MKALLQSEDLWGCIEEEDDYITNIKKMTKAKAKLIVTVHKQNYVHIQQVETPKQVWESLAKTFDDRDLTRKIGILKRLTSAKLENYKSMHQYVNDISEAVQQLKEIEFPVQDEMVGTLLVSGLPDSYKPMIMGLESSGITITGDTIKTKLLQEVE